MITIPGSAGNRGHLSGCVGHDNINSIKDQDEIWRKKEEGNHPRGFKGVTALMDLNSWRNHQFNGKSSFGSYII